MLLILGLRPEGMRGQVLCCKFGACNDTVTMAGAYRRFLRKHYLMVGLLHSWERGRMYRKPVLLVFVSVLLFSAVLGARALKVTKRKRRNKN